MKTVVKKIQEDDHKKAASARKRRDFATEVLVETENFYKEKPQKISDGLEIDLQG